jgi:hypothetical protein
MSYKITRDRSPKRARVSKQVNIWYYAEGPTGLIGVGSTAQQAVLDLRAETRYFRGGERWSLR